MTFAKRLIPLLCAVALISALLGLVFYRVLVTDACVVVAMTGYAVIVAVGMIAVLPFRKWLIAGIKQDEIERAAKAVVQSRSLEDPEPSAISEQHELSGLMNGSPSETESAGRAIVEAAPCRN